MSSDLTNSTPQLAFFATEWFAIVIGTAFVAVYSWGRFDEPSYDGADYFARYQLRFSTSRGRYAVTKVGYVIAISLIYALICVLPLTVTHDIFPKPAVDAIKQLLQFEGLSTDSLNSPMIPLIIALLFLTRRGIPVLKEVESRFRGFFHQRAHIPDDVRRTVAQMRGAAFRFDEATLAALAARAEWRGLPTESVKRLIVDDDMLHDWGQIGSVLLAMSEQNRDKLGFDPLFLESFRSEQENIENEHTLLAGSLRHRVESYQDVSMPGASIEGSALVSRQLGNLRERLYALVACGVRSSRTTDTECVDALNRLGFGVSRTHKEGTIIKFVAAASIVGLIIVDFIATFITIEFRDHFINRLPVDWQSQLPVPEKFIPILLWTPIVAAFYFFTLMTALAVRDARIGRRQWFDISRLSRRPPVQKYALPTVMGVIAGAFTLFLTAICFDPQLHWHSPLDHFSLHFKEGVLALVWTPLAMLMALITLVLVDSDMNGDDNVWQKILTRSLLSATAMGVVGLFFAWFAKRQTLDAAYPPAEVATAANWTCALLAFLIALFVFVLSGVVQTAAYLFERDRRLAEQYLQVSVTPGPAFIVSFDALGHAWRYAPGETKLAPANALGKGKWTQFPEGTVIHWAGKSGGNPAFDDFGFVSFAQGVLIYEGFMNRLAGAPAFDAQAGVILAEEPSPTEPDMLGWLGQNAQPAE